MDYTGYTCPVCHEKFKNGEDIVVCPDCGTPHHRVCYAQNGSCANAAKHGKDYTWGEPKTSSAQEEDTQMVACARCGSKNNKQALFCSRCGMPLTEQSKQHPGQQPQGVPFGPGIPGMQNMFDPMAGVNPEEEFADNVKAGDLAAYIKVNTPYYMSVFQKIKMFGSGRFNLSAFFFSGGWLLYRKQYVAGAIVTAIFALTTIFSSLYFNHFAQIYESLAQAVNSTSPFAIVQASFSLPADQLFMFLLSPVLNLLRFILMIVCGIVGNKLYYKHCIKKVREEKSASRSGASVAQALQQKGGVNTVLAMVLLFSYIIMNMLIVYLSAGMVYPV
ncbi:MAG: RING finger protein [Acutalibacteraceae bacterium]|nr:RING finger protein [Acutalibacteraceae bacterium]HIR02560.1 DUF2628 domain-containing protein [Candidatus Scatovicinus merdipullorum]